MDCKVVLLGQEGAGKSSLVDRFVNNRFDGKAAIATVGASYAAKRVKTAEADVVVSLWDTAGAERFESLSRLYYSGAQAALICVDPTNASSFPKLQFWVRELQEHQPGCLCFIVLTKCDMLEIPPAELPPLAAATPPGSPRTGDKSGERERGGQSGTDSPAIPAVYARRGPEEEPAGAGQDTPRDQGGAQPPPPSPRKPKLVSDAQIRALAASVGAKIAATSAQTGQGVRELFQMVAADLAEHRGGEAPSGDSPAGSPTPQPTPRLTRAPSSLASSRGEAPVQLSRQGTHGRQASGCCGG